MPLLSIIIPHHNTPELLFRLLTSLPWSLQPEVIVVDDASGENQYHRVEEMREQFDFQLYHIDRHTAGAARNVGLQHATGQWLLFADADDYFMPDVVETLRQHLQGEADVVFFDVNSTYSSSGLPAYRDRQVKRLAERCRREGRLDAFRALHTNPWGKLIRRQLVEEHNIVYEEISSGEDAMFSVRAAVEASKVVYDDHPIYCITVSEESSTSNMTRERVESNGEARLRVNAYLRHRGLGAYQLSVLGYIASELHYGPMAALRTLIHCSRHGNNPFVGFFQVFHPVNFYHSLMSRPK